MVIKNPIVRAVKWLGCAWTWTQSALRPAILLWPWLLSAIIFFAFLRSSQGQALTWQMSPDTWHSGWTIGAVALSFAATLCACLLTSLVVLSWGKSDNETSPDAAPRVALIDRRPLGLLHIGWAFALSSAPIVLLAWVTRSAIAIVIIAILWGLTVLVLRQWVLRGAWRETAAWSTRLARLHGWRRSLTACVGLLATAPLLYGAHRIVQAPDVTDGLGPVFITMLGLSALSSLFATLFIALPYCTSRPRLAALLPLGLVAANVLFQPLADPVNPLLKAESERVRDRYQKKGTESMRCKSADRGLGRSLKGQAQRIVNIPDRPAPEPTHVPAMYFVSAEGGGIRAAYWTAMGLADLEASIPDLRDRIATMSGVSGGSLGIATWLAAVETTDNLDTRRKLIDRFLGSDLLSPAIAGLLFLDSPRLVFGPLWQSARRDDVFEAAVARRWQRVAEMVLGPGRGQTADFFLRPLVSLCFLNLTNVPTVYFGATEVLWGAYTPIGNTTFAIAGGGREFINGLLRQSDLPLSTVVHAVVLSARFPLLAPSADVAVTREDVHDYLVTRAPLTRAMRVKLNNGRVPDGLPSLSGNARLGVLVDGGYFDNSGLSMTRYALDTLASRPGPTELYLPKTTIQPARDDNELARGTIAAADAVATHVIHFSNDPSSACVGLSAGEEAGSSAVRELVELTKFSPACRFQLEELEALFRPRWFSWISSPIETILAVRTGHAAHEVNAMGLHLMTRPRPSILIEYSVAGELDRKLCEARGARDLNRCPAEARPLTTDWNQNAIDNRINGFLGALQQRAQACKDLSSSTPLPLGWALHAGDTALLQCLSANAALQARHRLGAANEEYRRMGKNIPATSPAVTGSVTEAAISPPQLLPSRR
jgi:hypothetical protein